jgi:hypothetical protein
MSGFPSVPDIEQLLSTLRARQRLVEEHSQLLETLRKSRTRLEQVDTALADYKTLIIKLLREMDTASDGNFGWEQRLVVMLTEIVNQADRGNTKEDEGLVVTEADMLEAARSDPAVYEQSEAERAVGPRESLGPATKAGEYRDEETDREERQTKEANASFAEHERKAGRATSDDYISDLSGPGEMGDIYDKVVPTKISPQAAEVSALLSPALRAIHRRGHPPTMPVGDLTCDKCGKVWSKHYTKPDQKGAMITRYCEPTFEHEFFTAAEL